MIKKSFFAAAIVACISSSAFAQTGQGGNTTSTTGSSETTTTQTTTGTSATTGSQPASGTTATGSSSTTNTSAGAATTASDANLTFTALLTASGVDKTLQGDYTIFAPSNDALAAVAPDTTAAGKAKLVAFVNKHIVKGKYTSTDLAKAISTGKGTASLTTLSGEKISLKVNANKNLEVSDASGNVALATNFNKEAPTGILHIIDKPLAAK